MSSLLLTPPQPNSSEPLRSRHNLVSAEAFCTSLYINAHNEKLSDAQFRQFVLDSLKVVAFPAPSCELLGKRPGSTNKG